MICNQKQAWLTFCISATLFACATGGTRAQDESDLVVRVYSVADLVFVVPDYPYRGPGETIQGDRRKNVSPMHGGRGGGFGGGTGNFSVNDAVLQGGTGGLSSQPESPKRFDMDAIIQVIVATVEPTSWDQAGGAGSIAVLGSQLVVMQSPEVHEKIEQLLTALRKEGDRETVTVQAQWLLLNGQQCAELMADSGTESPRPVNRETLQALEGAAPTHHGEITCFDGQTVHIVSGRVRSSVTSLIPVVGQVEEYSDGTELVMAFSPPEGDSIAQELPSPGPNQLDGLPATILTQLAGISTADVGYQPVITLQNSGVVLEFTPTKIAGAEAVVLDLKSVATRWNEGEEEVEEERDFRGVVALDRTDEVTQQLATTLRVPVGKPVLVGGLTLEPSAATAEASDLRLYLVVEVSVGGG